MECSEIWTFGVEQQSDSTWSPPYITIALSLRRTARLVSNRNLPVQDYHRFNQVMRQERRFGRGRADFAPCEGLFHLSRRHLPVSAMTAQDGSSPETVS